MFIENNPESDIKLDILYFSLEESKKKIVLSEISKYLFTKYGLVISIKQLSSVGRYNTVNSEILDKIKEAEEHVNNFLSRVQIIDNIKNSTGIYKYVRNFALKIGTYYKKDNTPFTQQEVNNVLAVTNENGEKHEDYKNIDYYKTHLKNHYVVILIDHLSLIHTEKQETLWQAMGKMSSDYCLHFRDRFGFTPVIVQQLAAAKETIEVNYQGKTIEEKLEPSLDALGDNKTVARDANVVLGLFAPSRYNILEHNGYDVSVLKDRYRSMSILKSRDGEPNKKLPLFFNGAVDFFRELPRADDIEGMKKVYRYSNELNKTN